MTRTGLKQIPMLLAVAGMLAAVGCQQTQTTTSQQRRETKPAAETPKSEPKAETKPVAQPAASSGRGSSYRPNVGAGWGMSSMAFPTGDEATSALLVHQVMPKEVRAGAPYNSEIHVTNLTNGTLQNVNVNASGFDNYAVTSSTPAGTAGGGGMMWNLGDLGPRQTQVIKLSGNAGKIGSSGHCVTASFNNTLCMRTNVTEAALAITKTGPAEVLLCDSWQYKVVVKNTGSGTASNVRVRDQLPEGVTTTDGKSVVELSAGDLGPGQAKESTITVKAARGGSFTNSAQASADGGLAANSGPVVTNVRQQAIAIKAECPPGIRIGQNATFKYTVTSTGDAACTGTKVTAPVPAGTTFVSADNGGAQAGGNVVWNLGNLNAKESKVLTMVVRSASAGTINASATASCGCAAPVTDQCSTGVKGVPDIGTGVEDDNGVVNVGENHVYRYVVKNQGQVDLTNVTMVAEFDAGLQYVATDWAGGAAAAGQKVTWKIGTLKPGEQRNFTFTAKGTKAGDLVVQTTTSSDQTRGFRNDEYVTYVD